MNTVNNINNLNNSSVNKIPNMGFWKSMRTTASSLATVVAAGAVTLEATSEALINSSTDLANLIKDSIKGAQASTEEWRLKCELELQAFQEDSELYKARQKILNRREWFSDLDEVELKSLSLYLKKGNK